MRLLIASMAALAAVARAYDVPAEWVMLVNGLDEAVQLLAEAGSERARSAPFTGVIVDPQTALQRDDGTNGRERFGHVTHERAIAIGRWKAFVVVELHGGVEVRHRDTDVTEGSCSHRRAS